MKSRILNIILMIICISLIIFINKKFKTINEGFKFSNKVPSFLKEERKILKKILPDILQRLEKPEIHYIQNIDKKKDKYYITIYPLFALQVGLDPINKSLTQVIGNTPIFVFDKDLQFIEKLSYE